MLLRVCVLPAREDGGRIGGTFLTSSVRLRRRVGLAGRSCRRGRPFMLLRGSFLPFARCVYTRALFLSGRRKPRRSHTMLHGGVGPSPSTDVDLACPGILAAATRKDRRSPHPPRRSFSYVRHRRPNAARVHKTGAGGAGRPVTR